MADTKISALTALTGANVDTAADVLALVDTDAAVTKKILVDELIIGLLRSTTARFKVGSFTRDISTASGTQAITGVGFQPKAVLFIGCINDTVSLTAGFDDGTIAGSVVQNQPAAVGNFHVDTTDSVWGLPAGGTGTGTASHGHITTLGSDGFTITWTKDGSPTGTLTVIYVALR